MKNLTEYSPQEFIAKGPLPEFFVEREDVLPQKRIEFVKLIGKGAGERATQKFLQDNPVILTGMLHGGELTWVVPQKRFGDKYILDFILGEYNSLGYHWYPVELKSPAAPLFKASGDLSNDLSHAIRQIVDWRSWLNNNLEYARKSRVNGGLDLTMIQPAPPGIIFIGRRTMLNENTELRRQEMSRSLNIKIHTFDHLLEFAGRSRR